MSALLSLALMAAAGQPTYLQCVFSSNGIAVDFLMDEANSTVAVSLASTGHTAKVGAAFTPTEVRFRDDMLTYVISRTDLTARRTITSIDSTDTGRCTVQAAPKRAF